MNIEKQEVYPGVFSLRFDTQYECCATFMRLQEFYESPCKHIRNNVFTLEEFMDYYAKQRGNFTYTKDWGGFNVPGNVVKQFYRRFSELLKKEERLSEVISDQLYGSEPFYLIGHYGKESNLPCKKKGNFYSALAHEIAHGIFHLKPDYKKNALKLIRELPKETVKLMTKRLLKMGYSKGLVKDEIQAYLATSDASHLKTHFYCCLFKIAKPFRDLFKSAIVSNQKLS